MGLVESYASLIVRRHCCVFWSTLVGSLLYCPVQTRPDVAYSVGYLCRAMSRPTPELHDAALRVLAYLNRTKTIGLRYEASDRLKRANHRVPFRK